MAKVDLCTIKVDCSSQAKVTDLLARRYGYQELIFSEEHQASIANPETKAEFVQRKIVELVRAEITAQRKQEFDEVDDGVE